MMHAAIYARYYARDVENEHDDVYVRSCEDYSERFGVPIAEIYRDDPKTARKEFARMIADCKKGLFSVVLIYSADRWLKDDDSKLKLRNTLKGLSVHLVILSDMNEHDNINRLTWEMVNELGNIENQRRDEYEKRIRYETWERAMRKKGRQIVCSSKFTVRCGGCKRAMDRTLNTYYCKSSPDYCIYSMRVRRDTAFREVLEELFNWLARHSQAHAILFDYLSNKGLLESQRLEAILMDAQAPYNGVTKVKQKTRTKAHKQVSPIKTDDMRDVIAQAKMAESKIGYLALIAKKALDLDDRDLDIDAVEEFISIFIKNIYVMPDGGYDIRYRKLKDEHKWPIPDEVISDA